MPDDRVQGDRELLYPIADQVGQRFRDFVDRHMHDFIAHESDLVEAIVKSIKVGENLPWHLLHYYDIPDRPMLYTSEEASVIESTLFAHDA